MKNISDINNISRTRVKVIGFGNKFSSDDGIGPVIIEKLEKSSFSEDKTIEIIDLGTSGSDLIFHIKECPRIIIIDALDAGQDAGKVIKIKESDIQRMVKRVLSENDTEEVTPDNSDKNYNDSRRFIVRFIDAVYDVQKKYGYLPRDRKHGKKQM